MERFLFMLKKFIPRPVFDFFQPAYHWCLAMLSALWYRFPSREMKVVGITGTSGKTTTAEMLFRIFFEGGFKTGDLEGFLFKVFGRLRAEFIENDYAGSVSYSEIFARRQTRRVRICFSGNYLGRNQTAPPQ